MAPNAWRCRWAESMVVAHDLSIETVDSRRMPFWRSARQKNRRRREQVPTSLWSPVLGFLRPHSAYGTLHAYAPLPSSPRLPIRRRSVCSTAHCTRDEGRALAETSSASVCSCDRRGGSLSLHPRAPLAGLGEHARRQSPCGSRSSAPCDVATSKGSHWGPPKSSSRSFGGVRRLIPTRTSARGNAL